MCKFYNGIRIILSVFVFLLVGVVSAHAEDASEEREVVVRPAPQAPNFQLAATPAEAAEPVEAALPEAMEESNVAESTEQVAAVPEALPISDAEDVEGVTDEEIAATADEIAEEEEAAPSILQPVAGPGVSTATSAAQGISVDPGQDENMVVDIEIRGNQIISSGTILNKIKTRRGDVLRQGVVN